MLELKGKYNTAKVFTNDIENEAISQIIELCNREEYKDSRIRIMPDVHAGAGCTIGTTMTIKDKVCVNLVGVDIGCGMLTVKLKDRSIDFEKLDKVIRQYIPSGQNVRDVYHNNSKLCHLSKLKCFDYINEDRALKSIGTLGGGNHFIEVDKDKNNNLYLVIHTGSRYLGNQVAKYYQKIAIDKLSNNNKEKQDLINKLKAEGREREIESKLKEIKPVKINKQLAYVEGEDFNNYINDMIITQKYAEVNRMTIAQEIIKNMNFNVEEQFETIHNYIDVDNMILRKGAIAAYINKKVLIPLNMRDGSVIGFGKGNKNWNYSSAHGGGRKMSRSVAKENITLEEFKDSMKGIWSTSVCQSTIDESPMAYKDSNKVIDNLKDNINIIDVIKPVYNYKASE